MWPAPTCLVCYQNFDNYMLMRINHWDSVFINSLTMMGQNVFCNSVRSHYEGVTRQTPHPHLNQSLISHERFFWAAWIVALFCPTSTIWPRSFHQFNHSASDMSSPLYYWWWVGRWRKYGNFREGTFFIAWAWNWTCRLSKSSGHFASMTSCFPSKLIAKFCFGFTAIYTLQSSKNDNNFNV